MKTEKERLTGLIEKAEKEMNELREDAENVKTAAGQKAIALAIGGKRTDLDKYYSLMRFEQ